MVYYPNSNKKIDGELNICTILTLVLKFFFILAQDQPCFGHLGFFKAGKSLFGTKLWGSITSSKITLSKVIKLIKYIGNDALLKVYIKVNPFIETHFIENMIKNHFVKSQNS
jgi:hypothetical protein